MISCCRNFVNTVPIEMDLYRFLSHMILQKFASVKLVSSWKVYHGPAVVLSNGVLVYTEL